MQWHAKGLFQHHKLTILFINEQAVAYSLYRSCSGQKSLATSCRRMTARTVNFTQYYDIAGWHVIHSLWVSLVINVLPMPLSVHACNNALGLLFAKSFL